MKVRNLIIVPGHASFRAEVTTVPQNPLLDIYWSLFPFQKGEISYYAEHIQKGLELARNDSSSLLIFSGGGVREGIGDWTEGDSYFVFAEWLAKDDPEQLSILKSRTFVERYASNSFQNLLFSVLSYKLHSKMFPANHEFSYPLDVTVVGWETKRERFFDHAAALRLDLSHFYYESVNTFPGDMEFHLKREAQTRELFKKNLYGLGDGFSNLRSNRNELVTADYYKDMLHSDLVVQLLSFIENPGNASTPLPEPLQSWFL
jgi:hypothetical protein